MVFTLINAIYLNYQEIRFWCHTVQVSKDIIHTFIIMEIVIMMMATIMMMMSMANLRMIHKEIEDIDQQMLKTRFPSCYCCCCYCCLKLSTRLCCCCCHCTPLWAKHLVFNITASSPADFNWRTGSCVKTSFASKQLVFVFHLNFPRMVPFCRRAGCNSAAPRENMCLTQVWRRFQFTFTFF